MGAILFSMLFSYSKPSIHQPYELYVRFHIRWPYIQWISTVCLLPYENNMENSIAPIIFIRLALSSTYIRVWRQWYENKLCHFSLLLPQTFFKKEQNFHCSNGESGEESCCGCLKNGLNPNPQPKKLYSIQIKVKNSSPQSQGSSLHMAFIFTQHIKCNINFHMDAGFFDSFKLA